MSESTQHVQVVPLDPGPFKDRVVTAQPNLTLRALLAEHPALTTEPLDPALLDLPVVALSFHYVQPDADARLYVPLPGELEGVDAAALAPDGDGSAGPQAGGIHASPALGLDHPSTVTEREAVLITYEQEIVQAAHYLESGLSVLVECEKVLVEHLAAAMAMKSGRVRRFVVIGDATEGNRRSKLVDAVYVAVNDARPGEVVVLPHLDLLASGSDASLSAEARLDRPTLRTQRLRRSGVHRPLSTGA